jgi:hypothetical protein
MICKGIFLRRTPDYWVYSSRPLLRKPSSRGAFKLDSFAISCHTSIVIVNIITIITIIVIIIITTTTTQL